MKIINGVEVCETEEELISSSEKRVEELAKACTAIQLKYGISREAAHAYNAVVKKAVLQGVDLARDHALLLVTQFKNQ